MTENEKRRGRKELELWQKIVVKWFSKESIKIWCLAWVTWRWSLLSFKIYKARTRNKADDARTQTTLSLVFKPYSTPETWLLLTKYKDRVKKYVQNKSTWTEASVVSCVSPLSRSVSLKERGSQPEAERRLWLLGPELAVQCGLLWGGLLQATQGNWVSHIRDGLQLEPSNSMSKNPEDLSAKMNQNRKVLPFLFFNLIWKYKEYALVFCLFRVNGFHFYKPKYYFPSVSLVKNSDENMR
jgi:hypothetical protein